VTKADAEGIKHVIPKCTVLHYTSTVLLSSFSQSHQPN